jgi:hypothetical protein
MVLVVRVEAAAAAAVEEEEIVGKEPVRRGRSPLETSMLMVMGM